jgi:hypothetical protein
MEAFLAGKQITYVCSFSFEEACEFARNTTPFWQLKNGKWIRYHLCAGHDNDLLPSGECVRKVCLFKGQCPVNCNYNHPPGSQQP